MSFLSDPSVLSTGDSNKSFLFYQPTVGDDVNVNRVTPFDSGQRVF